jgi:hypothetical protein
MMWFYFWVLCSIGLCVCFCASTMLFFSLWLCSIIWSLVLWYLQHFSFCSGLLLIFRVFHSSIGILGLITISVNHIGILMDIGILNL